MCVGKSKAIFFPSVMTKKSINAPITNRVVQQMATQQTGPSLSLPATTNFVSEEFSRSAAAKCRAPCSPMDTCGREAPVFALQNCLQWLWAMVPRAVISLVKAMGLAVTGTKAEQSSNVKRKICAKGGIVCHRYKIYHMRHKKKK